MPEYLHLIGAEDVRAAGSSMKAAAETMRQAASSIDESLTRHRMFLEDWLSRLETTIKEVTNHE